MSMTTTLLAPIRAVVAPLARPWVVLVTLPVLMLVVVAFFVLGTESALIGLAGKANRARVQAQNESLANNVESVFAQAEDLVPALESAARQWMHSGDSALLGRRLVDMMAVVPALAWLSISLPDGTFLASYRDQQEGGVIRFTLRDPERGGEIFSFSNADTMDLIATRPQLRYDPRQRDFYRLAESSSGIAWTDPYLFFSDRVPGISCVRALRGAGGEVQAVVSVDIDLNSLSQALATTVSKDGGRAVLMAGDKVLAAMIADRRVHPQGQRLPTLADFPDQVLQAYATLQPDSGLSPVVGIVVEDPVHGVIEYIVDELRRRIHGVEWRVAHLIPRHVIEAPVRSAVEQARMVALIGAVVALLLALCYAMALVDANRRIKRAEARADKAKADMRNIGAYFLVRLLGAGGMGAVWLARHHFLAKPAAMKFILPEAAALDEHSVHRFKQEARILAHLQSRHTIRVYDFGQTPDGRLFYVMEMLDGIDLDQLVTEHGPQPPARVLDIMRQVCASLAEAHRQKLVHRDIKPGNIVLCRQADELDVVKVLDFGLATGFKAQQRVTQQGFVQGTPEFMAPEQARDEAIDGRADLYALGCVAFWLLSGEPPFVADSSLKILLKHIEVEAPHVSMVAKQTIPVQLDTLIHWCLTKDPERRPASAEVLRAALDEIDLTTAADWDAARRVAWWQQIPAPDYSLDESEQLATGEAIMVHGPRSTD